MKGSRPRPTSELMARLRAGKDRLRASRRSQLLPLKVRGVLELQRFHVPLLARHRLLRSWERPWDIAP